MKPEDRGGEKTRENDDRHRPGDEGLIGGQREDEEADVAAAERRLDPDASTMAPEEVRLPVSHLGGGDE